MSNSKVCSFFNWKINAITKLQQLPGTTGIKCGVIFKMAEGI
jgi:hypothetical protein